MPPTGAEFDDQWPAGDPALASFAEDLRIVAGGPAPEPRPGLLAVMRQGATVPFESPVGRRKMLVKTLVGTLTAKVALGLGVAAASVTAVGAVGVLPDPAQHAVASVVAATTPFALPDPSDVTLHVGDPSSTVSADVADADESDDDATHERKVNHGACVSAVARDKAESESAAEPNAHGKTVSSIARSDCGKPESTTSTSSTSTSTTTTVAEADRSANSGKGNSGNNSGGNGNNAGKGNSGKN